ncbi:MAG: hypothetical protein AB8B96_12085 [Lysobacterales bacterium]
MKTNTTLAIIFGLLMGYQANAQTLGDPFEPDDLRPLAGGIINGATPDIVLPPDIDLTVELPDIERWTIEGRDFADALDIDWVIFYIDQYRFEPLAGQIRIAPANAFSQENLRVEVVTFNRRSLLDFSILPTILQSCADAPVGESIVNLTELDFFALYRFRRCPGVQKQGGKGELEPQPYDLEFEISDRTEANNQLAKLSGNVRDVRSDKVVPGTAVFTQVNDITFGNPETGEWEFAAVNAPIIVLDFLAADIESIGPLNIGPVAPTQVVSMINLQAAPAGLVFFSGFE